MRTMALAMLFMASGTLGERRQLEPPPLAEFSARAHMTESYRLGVDQLCGTRERTYLASLQDTCKTLNSTLNQRALLQQLNLARDFLETLEEGRAAVELKMPERQRVFDILSSLLRQVQAGHYVLSVPVEFEVDRDKRLYQVHWPTWVGDHWRGSWIGPEVHRSVSFIPEMEVTVEATFRTSGGTISYGYRLRNGIRSEGGIAAIHVECVGLTQERIRQMAELPRYRTLDAGFARVWFPRGGFLQDFILQRFDAGEKLLGATPGEVIEIPAVLQVPWTSLPGVVMCWVPVRGFDYPPGMDAELDPEDVSRIFVGGVEEPVSAVAHAKSVPRYAYTGKTVGPVPLPRPNQRVVFAQRIIGDFKIARYWGWCVDQASADSLESELNVILRNPSDTARIAAILPAVEAGSRSGALLDEAYLLLKYNLQYLADDSHWVGEY